MIAVSLKEGDDIVNLLLKKGAEVNAKSMFHSCCATFPSDSYSLPFRF